MIAPGGGATPGPPIPLMGVATVVGVAAMGVAPLGVVCNSGVEA